MPAKRIAAKHTPGPWIVENLGKKLGLRGWVPEIGDVCAVEYTSGPKTHVLTRIVMPLEHKRVDGGREWIGWALPADIALIAAAPDLYEALKEVLLVVQASETGSPASSGEKWDAAFDAARAAIEKAEGRAS